MDVGNQLYAPAAFNKGKDPWYPLDRMLCRPQNWPVCWGEVTNLLPVPGFEPPIVPAHSLATVQTVMSWLLLVEFKYSKIWVIWPKRDWRM